MERSIQPGITGKMISDVTQMVNNAYGGTWDVATGTFTGDRYYFTLKRGKNRERQMIAVSFEDGHWRGPGEIEPEREFDDKYNHKKKVDDLVSSLSTFGGKR